MYRFFNSKHEWLKKHTHLKNSPGVANKVFERV